MTTLPKLLLLASRVPYPPIGGDRLKNLNLIRILSNHFEMHMILMAEEPPSEEALLVIGSFTKNLEVIVVSPFRSRWNVIKSLLTSQPLQVAYYSVPEFQAAFDRKAPEMDVILATTQRTATYAFLSDKPKVLDMGDSQTFNTKAAIRSTKSPLWKIIYWLESRRINRFEHKCLDNYDMTLCLNMEEREAFGRPDKTRWIPHGVSHALFTRTRPTDTRRAVAFLGKMDYRPNIEAVEWFCENVVPLLPKDVKTYILGSSPTSAVMALGIRHANVEVTGFMEDPYELMGSCAAVIAPMQSGSGIQNKVLEAMAMAMPVVATERAVRPLLTARDGKDILVEDTPDGMAKAIMTLIDDPARSRRIGADARAFVQLNFSWENWGAVCIGELTRAMAAHGCETLPTPYLR